MGHRPDLNSLPAASRTNLRNLMLTYINYAVVWAHNPSNPNAIVHHMGEHAFITHRNFIGDLENWLAVTGSGEFVPLPSWNPANPIPAEFNIVKAQDNGTPRPPLVNLNPGLGKPAGLVPPALCGIGDAGSLWDVDVNPWHAAVHMSINGTMGDITIAPAAPIFFCWHGYVDEIYEDWLRCHWSGWEDLGGVITSGVGAASWAANRLDCFVKGQNNHMWHKWWNGSAWSGWEELERLGGPGGCHRRQAHRCRMGTQPNRLLRARHEQPHVAQMVGRWQLERLGGSGRHADCGSWRCLAGAESVGLLRQRRR